RHGTRSPPAGSIIDSRPGGDRHSPGRYSLRGQRSSGRVQCPLSQIPLYNGLPFNGGNMQKLFLAAAVAVMAAAPAAAQDLESEQGQLGYSIGYEFGAELRSYDIDVDLEAVFQAVRDAYNEREPGVDMEIMRTRMTELQEKLRQERMEAFEALAEENQAKGEEFLAENRGKKGITTLPSGVQYRVI